MRVLGGKTEYLARMQQDGLSMECIPAVLGGEKKGTPVHELAVVDDIACQSNEVVEADGNTDTEE